jgi:predicted O-methyltransferase YrrM
MKTTKISELPIDPENYDVEHYAKVNYADIVNLTDAGNGAFGLGSLMIDAERRFINGLIRYYRPRGIIEIGVFKGGYC